MINEIKLKLLETAVYIASLAIITIGLVGTVLLCMCGVTYLIDKITTHFFILNTFRQYLWDKRIEYNNKKKLKN